MCALQISIPLCTKRKAPTVGGGGVSGLSRWRVFVEVDRLAQASWKKRLILLGITGSTLGDARQSPIPISPHELPSVPTPPSFAFLLPPPLLLQTRHIHPGSLSTHIWGQNKRCPRGFYFFYFYFYIYFLPSWKKEIGPGTSELIDAG